MSTEAQQEPSPIEFQPHVWVQSLSEADKLVYEQTRLKDIEDLVPRGRDLIEEYFPGIAEHYPNTVEQFVIRWATGLRNSLEEGIQVGIDNARRSRDDYARNAFYNVINQGSMGS